jgi:hypothetical protein
LAVAVDVGAAAGAGVLATAATGLAVVAVLATGAGVAVVVEAARTGCNAAPLLADAGAVAEVVA